MGRRLAMLAICLGVAACDGGTAPEANPGPPDEPDPPPAVPASVVVTSLALNDDSDAITVLENEGDDGEYRLEFYGTLINEPQGCPVGQTCCPNAAMGGTDPVTVTTGYSETVTWNTGEVGRVSTVVAYSRGPNTAVWTESSVATRCQGG